jgi:hypothetical protein
MEVLWIASGNFQSPPFDKLRAGSAGILVSRISTQDCVLG